MRDVQRALRRPRKATSARWAELYEAEREAATTRILDRAEGKPIQGIEHGLEEHFLDDVTGARLKLAEALTAAAAKALPAATLEAALAGDQATELEPAGREAPRAPAPAPGEATPAELERRDRT